MDRNWSKLCTTDLDGHRDMHGYAKHNIRALDWYFGIVRNAQARQSTPDRPSRSFARRQPIPETNPTFVPPAVAGLRANRERMREQARLAAARKQAEAQRQADAEAKARAKADRDEKAAARTQAAELRRKREIAAHVESTRVRLQETITYAAERREEIGRRTLLGRGSAMFGLVVFTIAAAGYGVDCLPQRFDVTPNIVTLCLMAASLATWLWFMEVVQPFFAKRRDIHHEDINVSSTLAKLAKLDQGAFNIVPYRPRYRGDPDFRVVWHDSSE